MNNYWKVMNTAIKRSVTYLAFRKQLLEDGNKAIKENFNEDIPAKLIFHESDPKHLVFVLPIKDQVLEDFGDEGELDEDTLESVAGGKSDYGLAPDASIAQAPYQGVEIKF